MTRSINSGPIEWDAETYDAVSDPQFAWGMEVLERLELRGDEAATSSPTSPSWQSTSRLT